MSVGQFFGWAWENLLPISVIASAVVTVTTICLRSTFAARSDVTKLGRRIDAETDARKKDTSTANERMAKIESSISGLATKEDVSKVLIALEHQDGDRKALAEKVEGLKEQLGRIEKPLDLIQEHLLNGRR